MIWALFISLARTINKEVDQGDRPLHPDAEEARMALILSADKENVPPAGKQ